ncbi:hypothetical protein HOF56_05150 [Candidatus Peribacteria bacterium]|jgi:hypothetical protein|nr:hypothetical protein [Candidatus Peribacteria bacterium]MBT4021630.1 hypothetical protein [Candidatus Peribacteria bacterium]MBT4473999.1 hypothetical protein [Candidatus Peribacteria bacterium]
MSVSEDIVLIQQEGADSMTRNTWRIGIEEDGVNDNFVKLNLSVDTNDIFTISQLMGPIAARMDFVREQGKHVLVDAAITPETHDYIWAYLISLNRELTRNGLRSIVCNLDLESIQLLIERQHIQLGNIAIAENVDCAKDVLADLEDSDVNVYNTNEQESMIIVEESEDQILVKSEVDIAESSEEVEKLMLPISKLALSGKEIIVDCQGQKMGSMILIYCHSLLYANAEMAATKAQLEEVEFDDPPIVILANVADSQRKMLHKIGFKTGEISYTDE